MQFKQLLFAGALCFPACGDDGDEVDDSGTTSETGSTSNPSTQSGTESGSDTSTTDTLSDTQNSSETESTSEDRCVVNAMQYQRALDEIWPADGTPGGISFAVRTRGCDPWSGVAGLATNELPLLPSHGLRVGSITKMFVAASILKLVGNEQLSLDEFVADHIPELVGSETITIRHLLQHSSGVFDYTEDEMVFAKYLGHPELALSLEEVLESANSHPLAFEPGTGFLYSNTNYILLGEILRAQAGQSVGSYIRQELLTPTGLGEIYYDGDEDIALELARGYGVLGGGSVVDATLALHPSVTGAAGALVATPRAIASWNELLFGENSPLTPESVALMTTGIATDIPDERYGIGTMIQNLGLGVEAYGHNGGVPGYLSATYTVPIFGITVTGVVSHDGHIERLQDAFERISAIAFSRSQRRVQSLRPQPFDRYRSR